MDGTAFDSLTRFLVGAASRRGFAARLAAGLLAPALALADSDARAKGCPP
jgi:hypothetical protein